MLKNANTQMLEYSNTQILVLLYYILYVRHIDI